MRRPRLKLFPLADIGPTEEVDPARLRQVRSMILRTGYWTNPIVVENDSLAVVDGHHRYRCAGEFGFKDMPVVTLFHDTLIG